MGCKKVSYRDKDQAVTALHAIKNCDNDGKKPIRAYECDRCGKWHLTSKPIDTPIGGRYKPKLNWRKVLKKK